MQLDNPVATVLPKLVRQVYFALCVLAVIQGIVLVLIQAARSAARLSLERR